MKRLTLTLIFSLLTPTLSQAVPVYYFSQFFSVKGPADVEVREKGPIAKDAFSWFSLPYRRGHFLVLAWYHDSPHLEGMAYDHRGYGYCPVSGVRINNEWIFSRGCFLSD